MKTRFFIEEKYLEMKCNQLNWFTKQPGRESHPRFINCQWMNRLTVSRMICSQWSHGGCTMVAWQIPWSDVSCTNVAQLISWWHNRNDRWPKLAWHFLSWQKWIFLKKSRPEKIGWADLIWTPLMKYDDITLVIWRQTTFIWSDTMTPDTPKLFGPPLCHCRIPVEGGISL